MRDITCKKCYSIFKKYRYKRYMKNSIKMCQCLYDLIEIEMKEIK